MRIVKFLGWAFLLLGIGLFAYDAWTWADGAPVEAVEAAIDGEAAPFHIRVFGELWFAIDPESLQLIQPAIERHLTPWLWDPVLVTILLAPASLSLFVLGLILILLGSLRRSRPRFRSR